MQYEWINFSKLSCIAMIYFFLPTSILKSSENAHAGGGAYATSDDATVNTRSRLHNVHGASSKENKRKFMHIALITFPRTKAIGKSGTRRSLRSNKVQNTASALSYLETRTTYFKDMATDSSSSITSPSDASISMHVNTRSSKTSMTSATTVRSPNSRGILTSRVAKTPNKGQFMPIPPITSQGSKQFSVTEKTPNLVLKSIGTSSFTPNLEKVPNSSNKPLTSFTLAVSSSNIASTQRSKSGIPFSTTTSSSGQKIISSEIAVSIKKRSSLITSIGANESKKVSGAIIKQPPESKSDFTTASVVHDSKSVSSYSKVSKTESYTSAINASSTSHTMTNSISTERARVGVPFSSTASSSVDDISSGITASIKKRSTLNNSMNVMKWKKANDAMTKQTLKSTSGIGLTSIIPDSYTLVINASSATSILKNSSIKRSKNRKDLLSPTTVSPYQRGSVSGATKHHIEKQSIPFTPVKASESETFSTLLAKEIQESKDAGSSTSTGPSLKMVIKYLKTHATSLHTLPVKALRKGTTFSQSTMPSFSITPTPTSYDGNIATRLPTKNVNKPLILVSSISVQGLKMVIGDVLHRSSKSESIEGSPSITRNLKILSSYSATSENLSQWFDLNASKPTHVSTPLLKFGIGAYFSNIPPDRVNTLTGTKSTQTNGNSIKSSSFVVHNPRSAISPSTAMSRELRKNGFSKFTRKRTQRSKIIISPPYFSTTPLSPLKIVEGAATAQSKEHLLPITAVRVTGPKTLNGSKTKQRLQLSNFNVTTSATKSVGMANSHSIYLATGSYNHLIVSYTTVMHISVQNSIGETVSFFNTTASDQLENSLSAFEVLLVSIGMIFSFVACVVVIIMRCTG